MKKINLRPLQTTITHEGAAAYNYKLSQPLTHLTFTFGAALFSDGFYEKQEEQVTRFAEALVGAARVEPKFPWQYGVWMRDPSKGKGNRIQGSLVPALLDALLGETPFTETYVERCLRYRPDDAIAFLTHFTNIEMREPTAAAKRGVAKALTHFDEYQLLKYASANNKLRLCDVILWVKRELEALGAASTLALTIGRYLHAPSRQRDPLLRKASEHQDGLVPLPLAAARRRLFALHKDEVTAPDFAPLVAEARLTWEQVMSQFGVSTQLSSATRSSLRTLAGWNPPKPFIQQLWRYTFLPRFAVTEAIEQLQRHLKESDTTAKKLIDAFLQQITKIKGQASLELIQKQLAHSSFAQSKELHAVLSAFAIETRANHQALAAPYEKLVQAKDLYEALKDVVGPLRSAVLALRNNANEEQEKTITAQLNKIQAKITSMAQSPLTKEATAMYQDCTATLQQYPGALASLLQRNARLTPLLEAVRNIATAQSAQLKAKKNAQLQPLKTSLNNALIEMKALEDALTQATQPTPLLQQAAARFIRLYQRTERPYARAIKAITEDAAQQNNPAATAHNNHVWSAILNAPGLLPDMAFLRNLRNLHSAQLSIEQLTALAKRRAFKGIWPYQIYAGALIEPSLEPVFEEILQRSCSLLPPGRHLGLADASGSMSIQVGGAKGTITCIDVALLFTAMMSQESQLGASFSDGTWGGTSFLSITKREANEPILSFAKNPKLRAGMGGTQVFGAVIELIVWLKKNPDVQPPDCLWFFSDMQFHPAAGGIESLKGELLQQAQNLGLSDNRPPLELAIELYRRHFGDVEVILWNLQAYSSVPVPSEMKGVLLVSGYDANTFDYVKRWRSGEALPAAQSTVEQSQEVILNAVREF